MTHPVVHWEIGGRDAERLRAFYADLFGWKIDAQSPEYGLVETGDGLGGGIMRTPERVPPYVTIYVQVPDLDAALLRATELGGKQVKGPTPIENVGDFALFEDPEGNVIGLLATGMAPAQQAAR
ncbi:VOC family protein [Actinophytocola sp.]|uniref:VOC family protein n=1 Tax=Actinophytocola sp. TaxID=1872138 RepID=UPI002D7F2E30|nr:VOC family protein [Actinophytocola sp.]HET9137870.1 VOC family protein [Actinophytocola sp.]